MNIHFYLDRNKKIKSKERTIWCYIRGCGTSSGIYLNTGEKINPEYWDKNNELAYKRGIKKYAGASELNDFLISYKENIKKIIRIYRLDNPNPDCEEIKELLYNEYRRKKEKTLSLIDWIDEYIRVREGELMPSSLRKFKTLKMHLIEFEKSHGVKISFQSMNLLFYDNFLRYLTEVKELVNNSAFKMIGLLKMFLKWCEERGINKYSDYKKFKIKEDEVDSVALTKKELDKLFSLDFSKNKRLEKARDLFLFGCYTAGRFTDLAKIEWHDIKDNIWYLRAHKTKTPLEIPLHPNAIDIIERYKENEFPLPRISNQKLNLYIKEICKLANISSLCKIVRYRGTEEIKIVGPKYKFVSAHTARRTFITVARLLGMPIETIKAISGHKNDRTFNKYVRLTIEDKRRELNKAWS